MSVSQTGGWTSIWEGSFEQTRKQWGGAVPGTGGPPCWNMPEWDLMRPLGVAGGDTGPALPRLSCGDTCTAHACLSTGTWGQREERGRKGVCEGS